MKPAAETQTIRPGLFFWQAYDPQVKTDLCCCALDTHEGLVFCDPVPLEEDALDELIEGHTPRAILLTNENHDRNSAALAERFGIDILARHRGSFSEGDVLFGEIDVIALEGFADGETVFRKDELLIFGDAVINMPPYGFAMLPDKYCIDSKLARESLGKVRNLAAEILVFAHGFPIVEKARERLMSL